jgi:hypothetical protein
MPVARRVGPLAAELGPVGVLPVCPGGDLVNLALNALLRSHDSGDSDELGVDVAGKWPEIVQVRQHVIARPPRKSNVVNIIIISNNLDI